MRRLTNSMLLCLALSLVSFGCAEDSGALDCGEENPQRGLSEGPSVGIPPIGFSAERLVDGVPVTVRVYGDMSKADALARLGRPDAIRLTQDGRDWEYNLGRRRSIILHFGGEKLCGWTERSRAPFLEPEGEGGDANQVLER